jgi:hypothetical protein
MRFKLLAGQHSERNAQGDLVTYQANPSIKYFPIIETHNDLVAQFGRNKFVRLVDGGGEPSRGTIVKTAAKAPARQTPEPVPIDEPLAIVSSLGDNVTADYLTAGLNDLLVLRNGTMFYVASISEPDVKLNAKALKQSAVEAFIDSILARV